VTTLNLIGRWEASTQRGGGSDLIPLDDIKPHTYGRLCKCGPRVEGALVIHLPYDRRNTVERSALRSQEIGPN
jgi:hypothetical protein